MTTKEEYDFADYAAVCKALESLPDNNKTLYNAMMDKIEPAAKEFLRTRTNSELIDIGNLEPSIYEYDASLLDWWEAELETRNWHLDGQVKDLLNMWHEEWAGDNSLRHQFFEMQKQVAGIQRKLDRIVELLEKFSITMSVGEALRLK